MSLNDYEELIPANHRYPHGQIVTRQEYSLRWSGDNVANWSILPRNCKIYIVAADEDIPLCVLYNRRRSRVTNSSTLASFQGESHRFIRLSQWSEVTKVTMIVEGGTSEALYSINLNGNIVSYMPDGAGREYELPAGMIVTGVNEVSVEKPENAEYPLVTIRLNYAAVNYDSIVTATRIQEDDTGVYFVLPDDDDANTLFSLEFPEVTAGLKQSAIFFSFQYDTPERSNFAELVRLCLRQGIDFMSLLESFLTDFDLDRAVGKQLDFIGAIVGVDRKLPFAIMDGSGHVLLSGILDDEDYRLLIRATIAENAWDGTNESLIKIMRSIFSGYNITYKDNMDMSMNYFVGGNITDSQKCMIQAQLVFPKPAGVYSLCVINSAISNTLIPTNVLLADDYERDSMVDAVNIPADEIRQELDNE